MCHNPVFACGNRVVIRQFSTSCGYLVGVHMVVLDGHDASVCDLTIRVLELDGRVRYAEPGEAVFDLTQDELTL